MFCDHSAARICAHLEHQQYGLGHIRGPIRDTFEVELEPALPVSFIAPDSAPVLNQGSEPWCEPFTAATGRRLTQDPIGQDGFNTTDLATLTHASPNGTTTAEVEKVLLSPGALCSSGPGSGSRLPVASCPNISSLANLKAAVMQPGYGYFVGLAVDWMESWFTPNSWGVLPKPDTIAGGHIFRVKGFTDDGNLPGGAPAWLHAPEVPALFCQNSWGTGWAVRGFFWLPYAFLASRLEAYTQVGKPLAPASIVTNVRPDVRTATLAPEAIHLIAADGSTVLPTPRTYQTIEACTLAGRHPGPAHSVMQDGTKLYLLDRNAVLS